MRVNERKATLLAETKEGSVCRCRKRFAAGGQKDGAAERELKVKLHTLVLCVISESGSHCTESRAPRVISPLHSLKEKVV